MNARPARPTADNIHKQKRGADGKVLASTPTLPLLNALNDAYQAIRIYDKDVPDAVIVVGASSKKVHGHFQRDSWNKGTKQLPEIMLSGESLRRGPEATLGTLIHEAMHAKAHTLGIQDTSRMGRYHNTRFKALGEEAGLVLTKDDRNGWSTTVLAAEGRKRYQKELTALRRVMKDVYRVGDFEPERKPREKRTTLLSTASGRTLRVPNAFLLAGGIFDEGTGEQFLPVEGAA